MVTILCRTSVVRCCARQDGATSTVNAPLWAAAAVVAVPVVMVTRQDDTTWMVTAPSWGCGCCCCLCCHGHHPLQDECRSVLCAPRRRYMDGYCSVMGLWLLLLLLFLLSWSPSFAGRVSCGSVRAKTTLHRRLLLRHLRQRQGVGLLRLLQRPSPTRPASLRRQRPSAHAAGKPGEPADFQNFGQHRESDSKSCIRSRCSLVLLNQNCGVLT